MRSIQRRGRVSPALSSCWPRSCLPIARSVSILASMIQPHLFGRLHAPAQTSAIFLQSRHPSDSCVVLEGRRSYRENVPPKSVFRHKCTQPYFFWRGPRGEKSDVVKLLSASSCTLPHRCCAQDLACWLLRAASGLGAPAGSAGHDNARVIAENVLRVAALR